MKLRRVAQRAVPIVVRYGALVAQFVVVAAVTHQLSAASAGIYLSLSGAVQATFFIAGFGLPDGMVRTVTEFRSSGDEASAALLLRRGVTSSVAFTLPCALLAALICGVMFGSTREGAAFGLWWLAYGLMFVSAQALVASGRNQAGTFGFYAVISFGLLFVLLPALLTGIANSLFTTMLFTVLGSFAAMLVFLLAVRVPWKRRHRTSQLIGIVHTSRIGVPIAAQRVVQTTLIWSPVWISATLFGPTHAGIVAVGSRLAGVVGAALATINFSIRPDIVSDAKTGQIESLRRRLRFVSRLAGGLVLAAIAGNLLLGREVLPIAFGSHYRNATIAFGIMLIGSLAEGLSGASGEVVKMIGKPSWLLGVQTVALVIAVVGQLILGYTVNVWVQLGGYVLAVVALYVAVTWRANRLVQGLVEVKV